MEVLVFELSGERYAVPRDRVLEVLASVRITPLPGAPRAVEGVVDVRGRLAAAFDLRHRFRLALRAPHASERMVLARAGERQVVFRCDRIDGLVEVDESKLEDPRGLVSGARYVAGVARLEDGLLLIHDLVTFLSEAESEELDRALESGIGGEG